MQKQILIELYKNPKGLIGSELADILKVSIDLLNETVIIKRDTKHIKGETILIKDETVDMHKTLGKDIDV